ncbi:hypothetical protein V6Z12_A04G080500 [Gossypium hirsutum]
MSGIASKFDYFRKVKKLGIASNFCYLCRTENFLVR